MKDDRPTFFAQTPLFNHLLQELLHTMEALSLLCFKLVVYTMLSQPITSLR